MDAYSPCPCGSGQKFKWCCHKVETYADRAQRLIDSNQFESAIEVLDEGLRKEPGNPWLLMRKVLILIRNDETDLAVAGLRQLLEKRPRHAGALAFLTRLSLETDGARAGAAQLQHALSAFPTTERTQLAPLILVVALFLKEEGENPAALKHLELARALRTGEADPRIDSSVRSILGNFAVPAVQKHTYGLAKPPGSLSGDALERFNEALGWAEEGLWSSAAAGFELLRSDSVCGPLSDLNLGLCRLWLADGDNAVEPLRRYQATLGTTELAVDLESLCQQFDTPRGEDLVERVHLIWPLRNRAALISALEGEITAHKEEAGPIDPEDEHSPVVDRFALLDRNRLDEATPTLTHDKIPKVLGRALVGQEFAFLETFDDGRLEDLTFRFRALAGVSIANAHPKTKVIEKIPRQQLALTWEWLFPVGLTVDQAREFNRDQEIQLIREVWPRTPHRALKRRTPLDASRAGNAEVALRAAVRQLEEAARETLDGKFDFAELRQTLRIPSEPAIDPTMVDLEALNPSRLTSVIVEKLDDAKLVEYYRLARRFMVRKALKTAAEMLTTRPSAVQAGNIKLLAVYSDLVTLATMDRRFDEAMALIRRGREAEAPSLRVRDASAWDMLEVKLKTRLLPPDVWVPELAMVLDRYSRDDDAMQTVMSGLLELQLVELVPAKESTGGYMIDTRVLQALLAEYGPRVTTASGRLGVSATKPEIWTPGASAQGGGGGGALWTPGASTTPTQGGKSNLIVPGR